MGKFYGYMITLIVFDLLFNFAGYPLTSSKLFSILGILNPEQMASSTFYTIFFGSLGIITALGLGGIVIGTLGRTDSSTLITISMALTVAPVLVLLLADFVGLFLILNQTNHYLALIVIAPLMTVYILTIVDWIRGLDN